MSIQEKISAAKGNLATTFNKHKPAFGCGIMSGVSGAFIAAATVLPPVGAVFLAVAATAAASLAVDNLVMATTGKRLFGALKGEEEHSLGDIKNAITHAPGKAKNKASSSVKALVKKIPGF